jgi:hypothetical protein
MFMLSSDEERLGKQHNGDHNDGSHKQNHPDVLFQSGIEKGWVRVSEWRKNHINEQCYNAWWLISQLIVWRRKLMEPLIDNKEVHETKRAHEENQLRNELAEEVNRILEVDRVGTLHKYPEKHMNHTNDNRELIINYF